MAKEKEAQFIPGETAQVQGAPEANTIKVEVPETLEVAKPTKKKKKSVKDILKTYEIH